MNKVRAEIKKEFDTEPVHSTKFLKTKMKFYGIEVTDFYDNHTCFAVISLLLWKIKTVIFFKRMQIHWKRKKVTRHTNEDLESSPDDIDKE